MIVRFHRRYQQVEGKIDNLKEYGLPAFLHSLSTSDSRIKINYWQQPAGYLNLRPQLHGPYNFVIADFRFCDAQPEVEVLAKTLKGRHWICCCRNEKLKDQGVEKRTSLAILLLLYS